jgi:hypothetical protein
MIVKTIQKAWNMVNEIFPVGYKKDEASSERAGYPIYRSLANNCNDYICDLNDRLEVNLGNGKSINIWIREEAVEEDKPMQESLEAEKATDELGAIISPLYDLETYAKITLAINGEFGSAAESKIYDGLCRNETWLASDLIASYCDKHGIRWGTITGVNIQHFSHGSERKGHFIIDAYIGKRG